ncbi:MAG: DUF2079 domain-containing protein [Cyanobacteriota bacterium]|nr:DUF2079 domain-containing protein [Cyanobacteriota bacterium]
MTAQTPPTPPAPTWSARLRRHPVWLAAVLFAAAGLLIQWWRLHSLTASYDQGIFTQVLWNGLHGHPFESTLSSQLSTNVIHGGQAPALGYHRLGQHFTPLLAIWIPLVGLGGAGALGVIQVGLITAAGLALHRLARHWLPERLAAMVAISFFGANAVLGPTWGNFTDLCQLPLLVFALLLALERGSFGLGLVTALLIPLVREDTGVVLMGVGVWLLARQRHRWPLALALILWGGAWVVVVTTTLMPLFSEDSTRRFMIENFGHVVGSQEKASSLEVLRAGLGQPLLLLRELVSPPDQTLRYLVGQALPLMFVPLLSMDAWLLMGLPLLGLLLARGSNNPLSINIRYTFLVVPGLFAGAALWWRGHTGLFARRRVRAIWSGCLLLSLLFTLTSNPNRSLSWLIPDSVSPWVHVSVGEMWSHAAVAREALAAIPPGASVAATTHLVPGLARREALVRFPNAIHYSDRQGQLQPVDWVVADVGRLQRYAPAFNEDRDVLEQAIQRLASMGNAYGVRSFRDGVVVLRRGAPDVPGARDALERQLKSSGGD